MYISISLNEPHPHPHPQSLPFLNELPLFHPTMGPNSTIQFTTQRNLY